MNASMGPPHPVMATSMDYFVSWAAAEVDDRALAQAHYTEQLELLPARCVHAVWRVACAVCRVPCAYLVRVHAVCVYMLCACVCASA